MYMRPGTPQVLPGGGAGDAHSHRGPLPPAVRRAGRRCRLRILLLQLLLLATQLLLQLAGRFLRGLQLPGHRLGAGILHPGKHIMDADGAPTTLQTRLGWKRFHCGLARPVFASSLSGSS